MNAQTIITKEYEGSRNFMTPTVLEYGKAGENRAWELSKGIGIFDQVIFGVSVVDYDPASGKTTRRTDISGVYQSLWEAREAIDSLTEEESK